MTNEPADNWERRAALMKCVTCMWYVPKGDRAIGRCRRHAPTLAGWPAVYNNDWCGDHKVDERAVALAK